MIHIIPWRSRLATSVVKPSSNPLTLQRATSSSISLRTSKYFHSNTRPHPLKSNRLFRPQKIPVLQSKRHCSHRRTMCKANADSEVGSMDVAKGREVLPTNVRPVHYGLTLEPDFDKFSYEGTVVMEYVRSDAIWASMLLQRYTFAKLFTN